MKDLLSQGLSDRDKALICLAVDPVGPRQVSDIKALAYSGGWRTAKKKNVSGILGQAKGLAARTSDGWELTASGTQHVATIAGPLVGAPVPTVASSLRVALTKISNADTKAFVEEAIACYEGRQFRAAVVLSWVGAVSVLQQHVVNTPGLLMAFNTDAVARFARSRNPFVAARKADDFSQLQEADFLTVLEKIGVINKNVKQELTNCLKLRNACGHPNSYSLGPNKVTAHIEDLILNVFSNFC
ncbi:MAG: hypothetical protein H8E44_43465 [Planctomycetes bacterium]|nr:hypothetical protein [Planctomycetota bacterium]MBL7038629.1 hypothetical protein [Pirellulaceae bacterium]